MPNQVLYVTVDPGAFKAQVQKYLDLSPLMADWNTVKAYKWPDALKTPQLWDTIATVTQLIRLAISAVEVAKKQVIQAQDPDGSKGLKFDNEIALQTAVDIVASLIHWNGSLGPIVNKLWLPFLNLVISIVVNGMPKDWVAVALDTLKIVA